MKILEGHGGYVCSLALSPDGTTLFSGSDDKTIRAWDTTSGTEKLQMTGHGGYVNCLALSPDGILTWGAGNDVYLASVGELFNSNILPCWILKDAAPEKSEANEQRLTYLKTLLERHPKSLYWANSFFSHAAEKDEELLKILFESKLAVIPCHLGHLLLSALKSGSPTIVRQVLVMVVSARKESDKVAQKDILSAKAHWQLPVLDKEFTNALRQVGSTHSGVLADFLKSFELAPAERCTFDAFQSETRVIPESGMIVNGSEIMTVSVGGDNEWIPKVSSQEQKNGSSTLVEARCVAFPNIAGKVAGVSFLEMIVKSDNLELFDNLTVKTVVTYCWETFAAAKFKWQFMVYLLALFFQVALSFVVDVDPWDDYTNIYVIISLVACGGLSLITIKDIRYEFTQLHHSDGLKDHFNDFWNFVDTFQILLTSASIFTFLMRHNSVHAVIAIAVYLKWFGLLYFMQAFQATAALVRMIIRITTDIGWFVLVLLIVLLASGNAIYVLLHEEGGEGYTDVPNTIFTMFNLLLLGDADTTLEAFDGSSNILLLKVLFVFSMFFVLIVLLNLLIGELHCQCLQCSKLILFCSENGRLL